MKKKGYTVLISENKEGCCAFDELILKVANAIEEAEDIVLNTINPMINGKYEDLEDLDNYLETLDNEQGYAPRFEIQEFELGEDEEQDTVFVASKKEANDKVIKGEIYKCCAICKHAVRSEKFFPECICHGSQITNEEVEVCEQFEMQEEE